jgi:hypothetical protein
MKCYIDNSVCLQSCIRNINTLTVGNPGRSDPAGATLHAFVERSPVFRVGLMAGLGHPT